MDISTMMWSKGQSNGHRENMCNRILTSLISLTLLIPPSAFAQVTGRKAPSGCVSVVDAQSRVSVTGRLTLQLFPGAPNFESIAGGDAEEQTFIVELPYAACIDDGGDFADSEKKFVTVQVSGAQAKLSSVLKAAIGRRVIVEGEGFAAHTGHHHAPLVLIADRVSVE